MVGSHAWIFVRICLLCSMIPITCKAEVRTSTESLPDSRNAKVNWTWPMLDKMLKKTVDAYLVPNIPELMKLKKVANISESCSDALTDVIFGLRQSEGWTLKMLDASGKIPSGILDGTLLDFGSFDECLAIKTNSSSVVNSFQGQYCMVGYTLPLFTSSESYGSSDKEDYGSPPEWAAEILTKGERFMKHIALWLGTCVPSHCTKDDVLKLATIVTRPLGVTVSVEDCQIQKELRLEDNEKIILCLLMFLAFIVSIGTLCDIKARYVRQKLREDPTYGAEECKIICACDGPANCLRAFSILTNTERLFGGNASGTLSCFHGFRFLSATWIILGHTYFYVDRWNMLKFRHLIGFTDAFDRHLPAAVIENFTIPVSTFFFMSGCLTTYTNWSKLEKNNGRLNVPLFFLHKYWRMTPALAITILLLFAMPIFGSGPLWHTTLEDDVRNCQDYWWKSIVYVSNWWDTDSFCLIHTWYLSALMQFYILGVVILLLSYRWAFVTSVFGVLVIIGGSVVTALFVIWNDFPMPGPGILKDPDYYQKYNSVIYMKPYCHVAVYLIGMFVGFILLKYRDIKIGQPFQCLGWTLSVLCALSSVYGIYGSAETTEVVAVYIALHRIGWTLALTWVTIACSTGCGGIVNSFLSWKVFKPLGDLSFLAYLLHPLVILYKTASLRERIYFGHTELVFLFLAQTVISFFLAYICYVAVELPFSIIESKIFSRSKKETITNPIPTRKSSSQITIVNLKSTNDDE